MIEAAHGIHVLVGQAREGAVVAGHLGDAAAHEAFEGIAAGFGVERALLGAVALGQGEVAGDEVVDGGTAGAIGAGAAGAAGGTGVSPEGIGRFAVARCPEGGSGGLGALLGQDRQCQGVGGEGHGDQAAENWARGMKGEAWVSAWPSSCASRASSASMRWRASWRAVDS